jgi:hypothetical protein
MISIAQSTVLRGAGAGFLGTLPQTAIGKIEDRLFLPPEENADIAPRLVHRVAERVGVDLPNPAKWVLGTIYHVGYGGVLGAAYALVRERRPTHPLLGGLLLGGFIYGITFTRWGAGTRLGAERPPGVRTRRMTVVDWSVALTFGIATALIYERMRDAEPVGTGGTEDCPPGA